MTQFVFFFSTQIKCEEWKEYDTKKISLILWDVLLQCNLNKAKINYLEKRSDKYLCWELISTLLLLMINKSVSQITFICPNLAIEALEKDMKYVQS